MIDIIIILILATIFYLAIRHIYIQKKNGKVCPSCPLSPTCKKNTCHCKH